MAIHYRRSEVLLICFSLFLFSCGEKNDSFQKPKNIKELSGKEVYESWCISCHGSKGNLGISGAADLSVAQASIEENIYTITNGSQSGKMTPFKGLLNEKEIDAVAQYIESLKHK